LSENRWPARSADEIGQPYAFHLEEHPHRAQEKNILQLHSPGERHTAGSRKKSGFLVVQIVVKLEFLTFSSTALWLVAKELNVQKMVCNFLGKTNKCYRSRETQPCTSARTCSSHLAKLKRPVRRAAVKTTLPFLTF